MTTQQQLRRAGACTVAITAAMALLVPGAVAAPNDKSEPAPAPQGEPDLTLEAGQACDFELGVYVAGGRRITPPRAGGTVIQAGRGFQLTFVNLDDTGQTLALRSNGSVSRTTEIDGGQRVEAMGHNVLILFPTDVPAGPSTTLYVGRVVYTVDEQGVFTVQSSSGRTVDICAALES